MNANPAPNDSPSTQTSSAQNSKDTSSTEQEEESAPHVASLRAEAEKSHKNIQRICQEKPLRLNQSPQSGLRQA